MMMMMIIIIIIIIIDDVVTRPNYKEPAMMDSCPFRFPAILTNKYCCCWHMHMRLLIGMA